jgi:uncharacterized cupredoxin-like copper-binding protein
MTRFLPAFVVAAFVAVAILTGGLVAAVGGTGAAGTGGTGGSGGSGGTGRTAEPLGPGPVTVTLDIEHSRFSEERIVVRTGTEVRFVVSNRDPINHELIVGPQEVHDVHEAGNHAQHPPVPGEVSIGPNAEADTTYRFDDAGEVAFACHLPGHLAYGMHGVVEVTR